jgi:UDP-2,3-diacylglucosamine pyrophosphatase LpxH
MSLKDRIAKKPSETKVNDDLRARNRELEKRVDQLMEQIAKLRKSDFRLPVGRKTKVAGKSFCRVIIPDTHGCLVDQPSISTFFSDLEVIKPAEIVMLGDHLECGGFLAQHHTLGYVAQTAYTFDQDVRATNELLDRIQQLSPNASIDYIEGNHERRIENWCTTQALAHSEDAEFLRKMFSAASVLGLEKRGIRWIRQGVFYDDLPLPATIKRGHCYFTHGSSTAKHAASEHVKKFGGNVVYGHTHRSDSYVIRTVKAGIIGAWSPGCLCVLQPLWQHTNPTDWSHGYGLQLVNPDGSFLHVNVPIIDGKSYLNILFRAVA